MIDGAGAGAGTVWGVAHTTIYGFDDAASELRGAGFRVFAPKVRKIEVKHFGRAKSLARAVEKPLFRGYLFLAWAQGSDEWAAAAHVRGVVDLLRSSGKHSAPACVPSSLMDGLLSAGEVIDETEEKRVRPKVEFKPGDLVGVEREDCADRVFRISRLDPRSRIRFLLQSVRPISSDLEVSVSAEDLVRLSA